MSVGRSDGVTSAGAHCAAKDLLWRPMASVQERFGKLEGVLMQQMIDETYMVP